MLPEKKFKRATSWKQLLPRCSREECTTRSGWTGMLHYVSGIRLNEDEWYCSPGCMEEAIEPHLRGSFSYDNCPVPIRTTTPMGLMMLARGLISDLQLRAALELQRDTGERIGACLMRLGHVSTADIASVIATQSGCPVFPADSVQPACSMLLPLSLMERYRMVPVHLVAVGRRLFVGFCEKVNHSALIAVEQMLRCETEACVIPDPKFEQVLEFRKADANGEVTVRRPDSAAEAARIIRNYVQQTGAETVRMHTVEGNVWTRLLFRNAHLDLVFEHPPTQD